MSMNLNLAKIKNILENKLREDLDRKIELDILQPIFVGDRTGNKHQVPLKFQTKLLGISSGNPPHGIVTLFVELKQPDYTGGMEWTIKYKTGCCVGGKKLDDVIYISQKQIVEECI